MIGYISKECILEVKKFTDGENAPCLIYIAPFIDKEGAKGLKGVVRIFRYYDGQADYVNNMMEHFINVYALKLKDELEEFEAKIHEKYESLLTDSPDDEGHITFKGIPLNGSIEKVRAKIMNAGFDNDGEVPLDVMFVKFLSTSLFWSALFFIRTTTKITIIINKTATIIYILYEIISIS